MSLHTARRALPLVVVAAGALAGCVSTKDIEGLHDQIADVQRQVLQIQKQAASKDEISQLQGKVADQMEALLKSEADMQVRLQDLSSEIDQLQSKLEDTNYRLAQLSQQIAATNQELQSVRTSGGEPGGGGKAPAVPTDPQSLYQTAYNDYLRGNYDLAILGFRQYLDSFPDTDLADNALYWIGESYFSQGKFDQAVKEFDSLLSRYSRSDKTASALLKKAYANLELGNRSQGVDQLRAVIRTYPGSDEANLARQRLQSLGVDGGGNGG